ncbi:hypothetical protein PMIN06_001041 [Paraphaeosphaeria minitans]|uniref:Uncharacterized protein n=1 Tax=Paraphaeosphaeria minitans TaxID=565426 RepID=A0A9P6KUW8_9PLEO|nr:hypothetical protein PMIN01_02070 [Paraphaeosphaeria minitans]
MPRSKIKTKRKLTHDELEDRLEEESPGNIDRIPSASSFKFFTDGTTHDNVYVRVGGTKVKKNKVENAKVGDNNVKSELTPVYVGLGDVTGSRMITFNVSTLCHERIIHKNKELSRIGTIYTKPFGCLAPLRYEHPSSSYAESLQWVIELRALTMFAFVWCGYRDEFFDFNKGEGFRVLVDILERYSKATGTAAKRDSTIGAQNSAEAEGTGASVRVETITGIFTDANTDTDLALFTDEDKEADRERGTGGEGNSGMTVPATINARRSGQDASALESPASKKRTHEKFVAGQKD